MIFVTVGTQKFQLNRLLKELDRLKEAGALTDELFIQSGCCDYKPAFIQTVPFLSPSEFEQKMEECDLLITHSGVGTVINGLKHGKRIIIFTRLQKYREHVDDHQLQIAESFADLGYVLECRSAENLLDCIQRAETYPFKPYQPTESRALSVIQNFLGTL